jgi:hypothetical protein
MLASGRKNAVLWAWAPEVAGDVAVEVTPAAVAAIPEAGEAIQEVEEAILGEVVVILAAEANALKVRSLNKKKGQLRQMMSPS